MIKEGKSEPFSLFLSLYLERETPRRSTHLKVAASISISNEREKKEEKEKEGKKKLTAESHGLAADTAPSCARVRPASLKKARFKKGTSMAWAE